MSILILLFGASETFGGKVCTIVAPALDQKFAPAVRSRFASAFVEDSGSGLHQCWVR